MPEHIEGTHYRLAESLTGTFKQTKQYMPSLSLFACLIEPLKRFVAIVTGDVVVWARSVAGRKECCYLGMCGNANRFYIYRNGLHSVCLTAWNYKKKIAYTITNYIISENHFQAAALASNHYPLRY